MMESCAVDDAFVMHFNVPYDNIDLYVSYARQVEFEFQACVDELLEQYGMSHLKVKSR
ncbi:MAG TPA: hypothetical protein VMC84_05680 [Methanocella sp.]|uniref:hypothetical protein n=1 Tax=Methanocella sp. TaxID=2052833 RepID=UPI002CA86833|nr:hypothetical protein [Methanocella sp.]HTY90650.1 hypothetical protein [Methanocella sp.]